MFFMNCPTYKAETDAVLLCDTVTEYHHICLKKTKDIVHNESFSFLKPLMFLIRLSFLKFSTGQSATPTLPSHLPRLPLLLSGAA